MSGCSDCRDEGFVWLTCVPRKSTEPTRLRWPCHCVASIAWMASGRLSDLDDAQNLTRAYNSWANNRDRGK